MILFYLFGQQESGHGTFPFAVRASWPFGPPRICREFFSSRFRHQLATGQREVGTDAHFLTSVPYRSVGNLTEKKGLFDYRFAKKICLGGTKSAKSVG